MTRSLSSPCVRHRVSTPNLRLLIGTVLSLLLVASCGLDRPAGGAGPRIVSVDDSVIGAALHQFDFSGGWTWSQGAGKFQQGDHYSGTTGDQYSIKFSGGRVALFGARAPWHGIAKVRLDGEERPDIDLYAPTRADQVELLSVHGLGGGTHELTVTVSGQKNPLSEDYIVTVDRIDVEGPISTATTGPSPSQGPSPSPTPGSEPTGQPADGIVRAAGTSLKLNGQTYRFTGVNAYELATYWDVNAGCGGQVNDLDAFFGSLRPNSMVRTWAFQDLATNKHTGKRDWTGIDRVVKAAERHGQRLILTIGNHWADCDQPKKGKEWYEDGYRAVQPGQPTSYWDYLREVVERYRSSPALGMWELLNEPEIACGSTPVLREFFDVAGGELKRLDPVHLLGSGVIGGTQCGLRDQDYVTVHQSPAIDVLSFHDYNRDDEALSSEVALRLQQMAKLGKPLVVGEAGIKAGSDAGCLSTARRAAKFEAKMTKQFSGGVSGFLVWNWIPGTEGCDYGISAGDPTLATIRDFNLGSGEVGAPPPTSAPSPTASATASPVSRAGPPMGFNHYNHFGNTINEGIVREIVDAMVRNGMREAGYVYVNIDDSWQGERDANGNIRTNSQFPSGIAALADYVHKRGMKLGIYTTPTAKTCAGRTGSEGHEKQDVQAFANWGVDYIKLDWCGADYSPDGAAAIARKWKEAIAASGRPMVLSINAGGTLHVPPWASEIVNLWRTGDDICSSWYNQTRDPDPASSCRGKQPAGIRDYLFNNTAGNAPFVGPGHWADPDMLEVGNKGLSFEEAKTHFSMWAMWSAPLLAGNDPRQMTGSDDASRILLNTEVIAVDQDPLSVMATKVRDDGGLQIWRKPLAGGGQAVALVNTRDEATTMTLSWRDLGWTSVSAVRDLWRHADLAPGGTGYTGSVPAHGTVMLRVAGS
ncbi:cellulase family glycosylhydrolase [Frankia nepalensis]|nr:cellulase family glycosylhydrolase [Frankia nepalensis]MBL7513167.1 cellulase family glycosylhydrolase [Frankia nepalensis]